MVAGFVYGPMVSKKLRNDSLISKLSGSQLEKFILAIKEQKLDQILTVDFSDLLYQLLNDKKVDNLSLDTVSLIFGMDSPADEQWDYLQKCIEYCPTA